MSSIIPLSLRLCRRKYIAPGGLELAKLSKLASNSDLPASKVLVLKCPVPFLALINLLNTQNCLCLWCELVATSVPHYTEVIGTGSHAYLFTWVLRISVQFLMLAPTQCAYPFPGQISKSLTYKVISEMWGWYSCMKI